VLESEAGLVIGCHEFQGERGRERVTRPSQRSQAKKGVETSNLLYLWKEQLYLKDVMDCAMSL
jgi:hypothetical protein